MMLSEQSEHEHPALGFSGGLCAFAHAVLHVSITPSPQNSVWHPAGPRKNLLNKQMNEGDRSQAFGTRGPSESTWSHVVQYPKMRIVWGYMLHGPPALAG